jgi:hypothetical protein
VIQSTGDPPASTRSPRRSGRGRGVRPLHRRAELAVLRHRRRSSSPSTATAPRRSTCRQRHRRDADAARRRRRHRAVRPRFQQLRRHHAGAGGIPRQPRAARRLLHPLATGEMVPLSAVVEVSTRVARRRSSSSTSSTRPRSGPADARRLDRRRPRDRSRTSRAAAARRLLHRLRRPVPARGEEGNTIVIAFALASW